MRKQLLFIFFTFFISISEAQLSIDTSHTVDYMVRNVLAGGTNDLQIRNIHYTGAKKSIGVFKCNMIYNKMIPGGLILTTGNVFDAIGPNDVPDAGSTSHLKGDDKLTTLSHGETYDAAVLEFDFTPSTDSISFNYFFASEEYPEYVNKNVNDVFGFFLSCEELKTRKNLAILEHSGVPITVDNINYKTNKKYYIENYEFNVADVQKWKDNKPAGELALTFQYDGFTTLLHAGSKVTPQKKYHIKLAIADVGDRIYDSAIFLEASSFSGVSTEGNNTLQQTIQENFSEKTIIEKDNSVSVNLNIQFATDSFRIAGKESFLLLKKVLDIMRKDASLHLEIYGHTDNSGTKEHNKILSLNRAKAVADHLISKGIASNKITYKGFGDSKPIGTDKALNRRVEFVFKK